MLSHMKQGGYSMKPVKLPRIVKKIVVRDKEYVNKRRGEKSKSCV